MQRPKGRPASIIVLIKDHHQILKDALPVLKDERISQVRKRRTLIQFLEALKMHAASEEETLYTRVLDIPEISKDGLAGMEEHRIASELAQELESEVRGKRWSEEFEAKMKVLLKIVESHIKEEEKVLLPIVREKLSRTELEELGRQYLDRCKVNIEDSIAKHQPHFPSQANLL